MRLVDPTQDLGEGGGELPRRETVRSTGVVDLELPVRIRGGVSHANRAPSANDAARQHGGNTAAGFTDAILDVVGRYA